MRTSLQYEAGLVNASKSALVELALSLHSHQDRIILVGGWAPYLLLEKFGRGTISHIGSIDIDLAIDPIEDPEIYKTIVEILEYRDYRMKKGRTGEPITSSFIKTLKFEGREYDIQVDFLTTTEIDREKHRTRIVNRDLHARMVPECSLAFGHNFLKEIKGILPGDGELETEIRMLDISGCLGMKGALLGQRYKEKDAYDIYAIVADCLSDPKAVSHEVARYLNDPQLRTSIGMISDRFGSIRSAGVDWVGTFLAPEDRREKERVCAQVYFTMKEFIDEFNEVDIQLSQKEKIKK
jgi:hypothetical protein